jgi:hypothetical protein
VFSKLKSSYLKQNKENAMRTVAILILTVAVSLTPAVAQGFLDIPATGAWVKVQDGNTTQWSAIPSAQPKTRIDLISYLDGGNRTSYYLIRSACSDGTVSSYVIKPGSQLGLGMDCNGSVVTGTSTSLEKVQKLPAEAAALLKR